MSPHAHIWNDPSLLFPPHTVFFKFVFFFDQCVRNLGALGKEIWSTRVPKDKKKMNRPLKALRPFSVALSIVKAKATKNAESKGIPCFLFPHCFYFWPRAIGLEGVCVNNLFCHKISLSILFFCPFLFFPPFPFFFHSTQQHLNVRKDDRAATKRSF